MAVEDVPSPRPGPGEVEVAVSHCGLCYTDVNMYRGRMPPRHPLPLTFGHEVAGRVAEVGAGVAHVAPGDRVLVSLAVTCDRCAFCLAGMPELCAHLQVLGIDRHGGLADGLVMPEENVHPIPPELSLEHGALLPDSVATAYHAIRRAGIAPGDRVAVFGATGGLGMMAAQMAARLRGGRVLAVGRSREKLAVAKSQGAWQTISARDGDLAEQVLDLTGGEGVEVAIECAGQEATVQAALRVVRRGGRVVVVGYVAGPIVLEGPRLMRGEFFVTGSYLSRRGDMPTLIDLAARGVLDLSRHVSHRVPLERAMEGITILEERQGEPVRVLVEVAP
jgi:2-desacetyl-2-hydroxyethyl bacteriochlorophyllide A dehydrogenase